MAKQVKQREFYTMDASGVYLGPVEAEECPKNATEKKPTVNGKDDETPVFIGGEWITMSHADILKSTEIRTLRNAKLSHSDFTQVLDFKGDTDAWAKYREELRNIPNQKGFPQSVDWPEAPSLAPIVSEPKK